MWEALLRTQEKHTARIIRFRTRKDQSLSQLAKPLRHETPNPGPEDAETGGFRA